MKFWDSRQTNSGMQNSGVAPSVLINTAYIITTTTSSMNIFHVYYVNDSLVWDSATSEVVEYGVTV